MPLNKLASEYARHNGKVSFRWSSYLPVFERSLLQYRDQPISMLEIGVLNGGSLELWGKYFSNAKLIVGCDTNPDCANLKFEDPRIHLLIGDATQEEVVDRLALLSPKFDLVIDDGSHRSMDIIRSFAHIFPRLAFDGLYVVEDLHASYWGQYEGGLYHPYSSMSFFKRLADVINHEHWGVACMRGKPLEGIATHLGISFDEQMLASLHSIEFVNSMCLIRKKPFDENNLGHAVIAGDTESVVKGHLPIRGTAYSFNKDFSQENNAWTNLPQPPDELVISLQAEVDSLRQALTEQHIFELERMIRQHEFEIQELRHSSSWKITAPLRWLVRCWHKIIKIVAISRS
jgi:hypothetical protein